MARRNSHVEYDPNPDAVSIGGIPIDPIGAEDEYILIYDEDEVKWVAADHRTLFHIIHFLDDGPGPGFLTGAYRETLPTADPFPTSIIWWVDNTKTTKILEKTITYTGGFPTTIDWILYEADGTMIKERVTDTIVYSGPFESNRTRVLVP